MTDDFTNPLALSGFAIPALVSRKTSTTVSLNAGEHLVISGLKQTDHTKDLRHRHSYNRIRHPSTSLGAGR